MQAIIETGGKQYLVSAGTKIKIEKLDAEEGGVAVFDAVLLIFVDKKTEIGTPYVSGASVEGKILTQGRGDKKIVFRYKAKVRRRKMKGHRQPFTEVEITKINTKSTA